MPLSDDLFCYVEEELVVPCQRDIIYHYQSFAQPQNGSEHQQTKKAQFKKNDCCTSADEISLSCTTFLIGIGWTRLKKKTRQMLDDYDKVCLTEKKFRLPIFSIDKNYFVQEIGAAGQKQIRRFLS